MGVEDYMMVNNTVSDFFIGGIAGGLVALGIVALILILLAFYIYFASAWYTIAKKLNYKRAWLAWIPIANWAMILQLGGFHWAWIFLIVIPIAGWIALLVLGVIANWRIFQKRKYPGWFSLSLIIPKVGSILYLIALGFVAWKDKKGAKQETPVKGKKSRRL